MTRNQYKEFIANRFCEIIAEYFANDEPFTVEDREEITRILGLNDDQIRSYLIKFKFKDVLNRWMTYDFRDVEYKVQYPSTKYRFKGQYTCLKRISNVIAKFYDNKNFTCLNELAQHKITIKLNITKDELIEAFNYGVRNNIFITLKDMQ